MDIIKFLKNGSGIHIKKENRGKFTSYCGGKVTSACIAKGKKSSDPAVRKRAIFAANARKWKHLNGGQIVKAQEGTKFSLGNFLNSDTGKNLISIGTNLFNNIKNTSESIKFGEEYDKATQANLNTIRRKQSLKNYNLGMQQANQFLNFLNQNSNGEHYGTIDLQQFAKQFADQMFNEEDLLNYKLQREQKKQQQLEAIQGSGNSFNYGDILTKGLELLGNKKSTNDSETKLDFKPITLGQSQGSMPNFNFGVKSSFGTF